MMCSKDFLLMTFRRQSKLCYFRTVLSPACMFVTWGLCAFDSSGTHHFLLVQWGHWNIHKPCPDYECLHVFHEGVLLRRSTDACRLWGLCSIHTHYGGGTRSYPPCIYSVTFFPSPSSISHATPLMHAEGICEGAGHTTKLHVTMVV